MPVLETQARVERLAHGGDARATNDVAALEQILNHPEEPEALTELTVATRTVRLLKKRGLLDEDAHPSLALTN